METLSSRTLLAGMVGGTLYVAGIATLVGPVANESPSEMAASLADGRSWALVTLLGTGVAGMLGLWFVTELRRWLIFAIPDGGEELGTISLVATTLALALTFVGMSFFYGATYDLAAQGGSQALRGLVDAANAAMMLTKFPGALAVATISIGMSRSGFPAWFANLGFFAVVALLASTVGLVTTDDFTQFGGPLDFYGTLPAALWSAFLLLLLYRGQPSTVSAR